MYAKGYIMLPLQNVFGKFPDQILVQGKELQKKTSFHVSLVCVKDIVELVAEQKGIDKAKIELDILESFVDHSLYVELVSFEHEFRHAVQGEKETIIIRCIVSSLTALFAQYRKDFRVEIPDQPTHVTLYTLQPDAAIGINSPEAMEQYQKISTPELEKGFESLFD